MRNKIVFSSQFTSYLLSLYLSKIEVTYDLVERILICSINSCSESLEISAPFAHSSTRLGDLAMLAGYSDQAHMTREVDEFAGVSPSAVLGKIVSALTLSDLLSVDTTGPLPLV